jgi:hypothetical protein
MMVVVLVRVAAAACDGGGLRCRRRWAEIEASMVVLTGEEEARRCLGTEEVRSAAREACGGGAG